MQRGNSSRTIFAAFTSSLPVLAGYLSIGFAFGFLLANAQFAWYWAPLMSIFIYSGTGQFLAITMMDQGQSPLEMGFAVLLVNARHMVYGFSLFERFSSCKNLKAYLIFSLTDETYGLLTTVKLPAGCNLRLFDFWISAFNHSYYILGSLGGALAGSMITWEAKGIEFSMTALFTVLLIEQIRKLHRVAPLIMALASLVLVNLMA